MSELRNPPNYREQDACIDCKRSRPYCDGLWCQTHGLPVYESCVCDDFKGEPSHD